jgi:long-chain acyl-CoA synthetase
MEQVCHWCVLMLGGSIGYYSGDIQTLNDDLKALKPTIMPVVPRLLNRFYDVVQTQLSRSNPLARAMFRIAFWQKRRLLRQRIISNKTIWDRLVFRKIQDEIGGRMKLLITGSAPVSEDVMEMCRVMFGATVVEGYGQTEATAMVTITWPGDCVAGHCGGPASCSTIRLADVPELNYFAKDGTGEVLIKGASVTKGYYKDEERTKEIFNEEGFLLTGDVGQILPNGTLKIIDRKKHIFKLAQGEYVAPEKVEGIYMQSPLVQVCRCLLAISFCISN